MLGIQHGYYPAEALERWQVDSVLDAISDIFDLVAKFYFGGSEHDR